MTVPELEYGAVAAVHASPVHAFSKQARAAVRLLAGRGVEGDAHCSPETRHRSRRPPSEPQENLRQVHLIQLELLDELVRQGFPVRPGDLGENITITGIDLLALPRDTVLDLGDAAQLRLTGLRTPCRQVSDFHAGLVPAVITRDACGSVVFRGGAMAAVTRSGTVQAGDSVRVTLPDRPFVPMARV